MFRFISLFAIFISLLSASHGKGCPDTCRSNGPVAGPTLGNVAWHIATDECSLSTVCPIDFSKCVVGSCYTLNGSAGYKCGCKKKECPGVCRPGRSGYSVALNECEFKPTCTNRKLSCEVQKCVTEKREEGFKCACPEQVGISWIESNSRWFFCNCHRLWKNFSRQWYLRMLRQTITSI